MQSRDTTDGEYSPRTEAPKAKWLEYGEPIYRDDKVGPQGVPARIRITYPTEPDKLEYGILDERAMEMWEENEDMKEHRHWDLRVFMTALQPETLEEFRQHFDQSEEAADIAREEFPPSEEF